MRPRIVAGQHGTFGRLDADDPQAGTAGLKARAMPVSVPPVPIPPTTMSTFPPVSIQISSAVVAAWMSGLAGLSNCRAIQAPGVRATMVVGAGDGPRHALLGRGLLDLRAHQPQHFAALR